MNTLNDVRKALAKAGCVKQPNGTKRITPWASEKSRDLVENTQDAFQEMVSGTFEVVSDVGSLAEIIQVEMLEAIGLKTDDDECDELARLAYTDECDEFWKIPKKLQDECNPEVSVLLKRK